MFGLGSCLRKLHVKLVSKQCSPPFLLCAWVCNSDAIAGHRPRNARCKACPGDSDPQTAASPGTNSPRACRKRIRPFAKLSRGDVFSHSTTRSLKRVSFFLGGAGTPRNGFGVRFRGPPWVLTARQAALFFQDGQWTFVPHESIRPKTPAGWQGNLCPYTPLPMFDPSLVPAAHVC